MPEAVAAEAQEPPVVAEARAVAVGGRHVVAANTLVARSYSCPSQTVAVVLVPYQVRRKESTSRHWGDL